MRFLLFLIVHVSLFAVDFDVVVVGTSPFSLFEALYQSHSGKKVLILEQEAECGGAWKSIHICGIPNVDLGCHMIGNNMALKAFLEEYAGCTFVSHDNPQEPFSSGKSELGYYFSKGCYELIDHLLRQIRATDIVLLTNTPLEIATIDPVQKNATVHTKAGDYTTHKLIVTPMSSFVIQPGNAKQSYNKSKYYHLYLLIQDPTPPRFSYQSKVGNGINRVMNLTPFVGLQDTGRHLIVVQTHKESTLKNSREIFDVLKRMKLVDETAYVLKEETYIYESGAFNQALVKKMNLGSYFELLQTGHFGNLATYIAKWKTALKRYEFLDK